MSLFEIDYILGFQDANDIITGVGHGITPANGEVRVRIVSGTPRHQKYIAGEWVDIAGAMIDDSPFLKHDGTRAMTGNLKTGTHRISNDGGAGKGLAFDIDGNAEFGQALNVVGALKENGVAGHLIPSGLIAMFDVPCPTGWTRFSALDDKFPRGAASYGGTGGSATAQANVNISLTCNSGNANIGHNLTVDSGSGAVWVGGSGTNASSPTHTHSIPGSIWDNGHSHGITINWAYTDSFSILPPYLNMIFCKKN